MSSLSQFVGGQRRVTAINNQHSTGGAAASRVAQGANNPFGVKELASGALTAATLATALSITGRGCINYCAVRTKDTTSRTVRMKVTLDGTVIFDSTSAATTTNGHGVIAIGAASGVDGGTLLAPVFQPVFFTTSLLVEIASSLSESNLISTLVNYEVHQ
jgi:hypothetical protein